MSKKSKKVKKSKTSDKRMPAARNNSEFFRDLQQRKFLKEFQISAPSETTSENSGQQESQVSLEADVEPCDCQVENKLIADVATSLWDIERKLRPEEGQEQDRKVRLAYRRATVAISSLEEAEIKVDDPTGKRYPQGGENWMKPIQLLPTEGLTYDKVVDTVVPVVYRKGQLIQRGEVFVAVPVEPVEPVVEDDPEKGEKPEKIDIVEKQEPVIQEQKAKNKPTEECPSEADGKSENIESEIIVSADSNPEKELDDDNDISDNDDKQDN